MAAQINYSWEILNLSTIKEPVGGDNYVCYVEWKKIGTDELGNTAEHMGTSNFIYHNNDNDKTIAEKMNLAVKNKKIIAYQDLTPDIIIQWVNDQMTPYYKKMVDNNISAMLESKRYTRTNETPLPWNKS